MPSFHSRGILSQQPKTEWKCAYNELLSGIKDLPKQKEDPLSGPIRKRSKTVSQDSFSSETEVSSTDKQRVRFTCVEETSMVEIPKCPTCLQVIAKDSRDFDSLMEKSVNMETMLNPRHHAQSLWCLQSCPILCYPIVHNSG